MHIKNLSKHGMKLLETMILNKDKKSFVRYTFIWNEAFFSFCGKFIYFLEKKPFFFMKIRTPKRAANPTIHEIIQLTTMFRF